MLSILSSKQLKNRRILEDIYHFEITLIFEKSQKNILAIQINTKVGENN